MTNKGLITEQFRYELARLRTARGISQQALADEIGSRTGVTVYGPTVSRIEAGNRDVRLDELAAIAAIFGVSVDALLGHPAGGADILQSAERLAAEASHVHGALRLHHQRLVTYRGALWSDVGDDPPPNIERFLERAHEALTRISSAVDATEKLADGFPLPH